MAVKQLGKTIGEVTVKKEDSPIGYGQCAQPSIDFLTMADIPDRLSDPTQSPVAQHTGLDFSAACKRKEQEPQPQENRPPKKPRLVFTDIQRRTLHAIFKETKRPSKEMQATIAQQLGLEVSTVANFFMNARRRSVDKWRDDDGTITRDSKSH
ncbi:hypothetical protein KUTeg_022831 [Tegillarca granosa]|uniref:Homeobox domain-containing protein n=1 Tax=Tegillarca granosa TaxID=220873 RepID=A0ABQ9E308_TEGGR|nr:hypothetical protein KUTeg_022831 [Tegillarca granosa]